MNTRRCQCGTIFDANSRSSCPFCSMDIQRTKAIPSTIKNIKRAEIWDIVDEAVVDILMEDMDGDV